MLSRVADSLYWMSRYLERAEHTVRLLDVNFSLTLDPSNTSEDARWRRLLQALGGRAEDWRGDSHELVQTLTHDETNSASIRSAVAAARENARQVREEIASEQWLQLNRLYHLVHEDPSIRATPPEEFLSAVLDGLHLFQGVTDTAMSHGEGWLFIQVGRAIERAGSIAALLAAHELGAGSRYGTPGEPPAGGSRQFLEWVGLLRCCTAFEAYCNVYTADLTESQILEFLLLNKDFPHAVRYSVDRLREALLALEGESGRLAPRQLVRVSGRLQAALHFTDIADVLQGGVSEYLAMVARECRLIHTLLYRDYIHYSVQTALAM